MWNLLADGVHNGAPKINSSGKRYRGNTCLFIDIIKPARRPGFIRPGKKGNGEYLRGDN